MSDETTMLMFTSTLADGTTCYTEQDGDVSWHESDHCGEWELRMTGLTPIVFESYVTMTRYIYKQFPELQGITIYK